MDEIMTLKELLSSSADVAIIIFAYLLWRMDRRLLTVELSMKSVWRKFNDGENNE